MAKKILILKFPYNSLFGGGERHTIQIVENLQKKGFNFFLVSSCNILLEEFKKRKWWNLRWWGGIEPVSFWGIVFFTLLLPFEIISLFFIVLWMRIVKGVNEIYCLTLTEKLLLVGWARLLGMKVVWMEHLRIEKPYLQNPYRFLYKFNSRFAKVITVSKAVEQQLLDFGVSKKNLQVIYNGVDTDLFQKKNKIENNEIVIGTACRLASEKGVDVLLNSFAKLVEEGNKIKLLIAGIGPEEQALKKLNKKLNISDVVEFVGFLNENEMVDFLNKLDIFCLTSRRRESFGIAVAEASACELPVVVTDISGLKEVVANNETGFVCPAEDVEKIKEALNKLIVDKNLMIQMGMAGRKRVENMFSLKRMIDEFEQELS